jgi:hypothetical protein
MPRGSLPGERRGGRQRGTPNKKTLLKNAVFLAAAGEPNRSPLDFMLALMRDPQVPLDLRIEMAATAAPFVHARPTRNWRPDPLGGRDCVGDNGDLKFEKLESKPPMDGSSGEASGQGGGENGGLSPLDFLLGLMADPTATPRQRVKAAGVAARYKHAYAHAGGTEAPTVLVVEDKFGFKVDPELARAERDDRLREAMLGATSHKRKKGSFEEKAAEQELEQIRKRRAELVARLSFPDGYAYADLQNDLNRLAQLSSKRSSRKKLTPEEDAEEAHLAVRVLHPQAKPPATAPSVVFAQLLRDAYPIKRVYRLETPRFEKKLTPEQADELEELWRQYPERAETTRNLVVRRLTEHHARRRLDLTSSDEGWPRI